MKSQRLRIEQKYEDRNGKLQFLENFLRFFNLEVALLEITIKATLTISFEDSININFTALEKKLSWFRNGTAKFLVFGWKNNLAEYFYKIFALIKPHSVGSFHGGIEMDQGDIIRGSPR